MGDRTLDEVLELLESADWRVRGAALAMVATMGKGSPRAARAVLDDLPDEDERNFVPLAGALRWLEEEIRALLPDLLMELGAPDEGTRGEAARLLNAGMLIFLDDGPSRASARAALRSAAADSSADVRAEVCAALSAIRPPEEADLDIFVRALSDPVPFVRRLAALGLGRQGAAALSRIEALAGSLQDPDARVRRRVVVGLLRICSTHPDALAGPSVRERLPALLADESRDCVLAALQAYGRILPLTGSEIAAIGALRECSDPEVRALARVMTNGRVGSP